MQENKVVIEDNEKTEETEGKTNWLGIIVGFFLGAFLFWLTIQAISLLMFSRTAA